MVHSRGMKWDLTRKPVANRCPGRFCIHWRERGGTVAPGPSDTLEAALARLGVVGRSGCGYAFGRCARLDGLSAVGDAYEPNEAALAANRLPWFFFIARPQSLVPELREKYVRESEALWGARHWLD